jgi:hypothetical protein
MKKKKVDKESFLAINLNELEVEWTEQPKLYFKWARKLAVARQTFDEKKAALELAVADLDASIRANPDKYELGEKVTEASIKNAILAQEEYTDAVAAVNDARYEKCVDLLAMEYFSVPRAKGENGRAAKRKLEQGSARGGYRRDD